MDDGRIDPYIRLSQTNELRNILGDSLYLAMINDYDDVLDVFSEQRFTDLWFGTDWLYQSASRRLYGLKPAIIYYAYSRMLKNQQLNVTRYGVKHIVDEAYSTDEEIAQVRTKVTDANSAGLVYQNDAIFYLQEESGNQYPEYDDNRRRAKKTGFDFFKVSGNRAPFFENKGFIDDEHNRGRF